MEEERVELETLTTSQTLLLPGSFITNEPSAHAGRGTYKQGDSIYSALVGHLVKTNKFFSVEPLKSRFSGVAGDVVIGRVVQILNKKWLIDIEGAQRASLNINAVRLEDIQRRKTEEDEQRMREFLAEGDLLVAEVKDASPDHGLGLHIRDEKYRRLSGGLLVPVNNCLIRKMKSHFVDRHGVQFIFALNGFIWLAPKDPLAELTPETFETLAKFRNLILILNQAKVNISPQFLFDLFTQTAQNKAKDLLLRPNRDAIINLAKNAALARHLTKVE